jgi:hypothetical protein
MKKIVEYLPGIIDFIPEVLDRFFGSTRTLRLFNNRSLLAFLLPFPVFLFMLSGPSQWPFPLRGGFTACLIITVAVIILLLYFPFSVKRFRGMAWIHFGSVTILFVLIWYISEPAAKQASDSFYRHYYLLLAPLVILR